MNGADASENPLAARRILLPAIGMRPMIAPIFSRFEHV